MPESRKRVKKLSMREKLRAMMHKLRRTSVRRRTKTKTTVVGRSKFTSESGREYRVIRYSTGGATLVRRLSKPKGKANVKRQKRERVAQRVKSLATRR